MKKIKTAVQQILHSEKRNNLFSLTFHHFPVWPYYRMYFYYTLMYEKGILDASGSPIRFSWEYIRRLFDLFNIAKLFKKSDYFILEHARFDQDKKDIYTEEISAYLGKEKCSFFSYSEKGDVGKGSRVLYLDLLKIVSKIFSRPLSYLIRHSYFDTAYVAFLEDLEITDTARYQKQYKRYYIEWVIQYYFYRMLLRRKQVKRVILVVSYYNMPLVCAAKKLGIEVVEMQHGVISAYHLGYHFPYTQGDCFPDKLLLFGDYWKEVAAYPRRVKLGISGNTFIAMPEEVSFDKERDTILVISQATIGEKLQTLILNNREALEVYQIYFKLHPSEFNEMQRRYQGLMTMPNVSLIRTEQTVEQLQLRCMYQIGIYSTAIYEGIEKQCKTLLLEETGIEYMASLIQREIVKTVDYDDDIVAVMQTMSIPKKIRFFEPFHREQEVLG